MKAATIIAIISVGLETLASLYYLMQSLEFFRFNETISKIIQPLFLLSNLGLLVFFIVFLLHQYNKE